MSARLLVLLSILSTGCANDPASGTPDPEKALGEHVRIARREGFGYGRWQVHRTAPYAGVAWSDSTGLP